MQPKPIDEEQGNLFTSRLSQQLNPQHELLKLAKVIPWAELEKSLSLFLRKVPAGRHCLSGLLQD